MADTPTANQYNPIQQVGDSLSTMKALTYKVNNVDVLVRTPASYLWKLEDVSNADSGRTEDTKMYKNREGQLVGLELSWSNIGTAEASAIIKAFNPEYVFVNYLDLLDGGFRTDEFYVGNRSAPMYNGMLGLWSDVSFNLILRTGRNRPGD